VDVTLAVIYHDPEGRLYEQLVHVLPVLTGIFGGLTVAASHARTSVRWPSSLLLTRLSSAGRPTMLSMGPNWAGLAVLRWRWRCDWIILLSCIATVIALCTGRPGIPRSWLVSPRDWGTI